MSVDISSIRSIADTGEGLVAITTDEAPHRKDVPLRDFLRRIGEAFEVDVVFVSQFINGRGVFRAVDCNPDDELAIAENASDPLEEFPSPSSAAMEWPSGRSVVSATTRTQASAARSKWRHCAALPRCWRTPSFAEIAPRRCGPFSLTPSRLRPTRDAAEPPTVQARTSG